MKKIYVLLLAAFGAVSYGQTIYSENFGTPNGTTAIAAYSTGAAPATFNNAAPVAYTGTGDIRATAVSSAYTGASGGGNVFLTGTAGKYIQIDGINTSNYSSANMKLFFGYITASATVQLVVEFSTNAADATPTWTPISFTNNTTTSWNLVTIPGGVIPASATLSLRFTQPATTQMRIDDVKIANVSANCTIALGTPTTLCDAITSAIDTYTITLPFTGAGNGTFSIQTSAGTVSGDNPTTMAAGNITISGVNEGTPVNVTVSSGVACSQSTTIVAPDCKPVNALPYYEPFNVTAGTNIGTLQTWTSANTGNDVTVVTGSLTYPGAPTAGNAAQLNGAGKDPWSAFTAVTSGTLYNSFTMKVSDFGTIADAKEFYFYGLTTSTISTYLGRMFLKHSGTQYLLGFDTVNTPTTTTYGATLYNVGDTIMILMSYDFNAMTYNVWVNPNLSSLSNLGAPTFTKLLTSTTVPTNIGGVQLRQDQATTTPMMVIDEIRVATDITQLLANDNFTQIAGLQVYPNPVNNGKLFISSDSLEDKQVTIFDMLGKMVLSTKVSGNEAVNVSELLSGAYLVKVTENGITETRKCIVK
ncbi:MAG: hypothetical protein CFE24_02785 [Flavobacterium sp. BFFFF2]|nr:MAG: hypothetical protein CFE24_02785 [Flavobacterium sp. BFFFF2]